MTRKALWALAAWLLMPVVGFSQVVLPPGALPQAGVGYPGQNVGINPTTGMYPGNLYGSYPGGQVVNGINYPGTIPPGTLPGSVGSVPGYNMPIPGQGGLQNPYDDPRYSRQYGNRYMDNTNLNRGLSPAIVPALMGAVVGAVLGAHFGIKGIMLGGIAGFLIGNAVWQHFTGQSVFDYLFYGPWYMGPMGAQYGGYNQMGGYGGYGSAPYGTPYGSPYGNPYTNPYMGGSYMGPGGNPFGAVNRLTVNGGLFKAPAAPEDDLGALRKSYFDTVGAYEAAAKEGGQKAIDARAAMESARSAYQRVLGAAAGASK